MSACHATPAQVQPEGLDASAVAARMVRHQPRIDELLRRYPVRRAVLLPVLWLAQEEFGWVPRAAIAWAAGIAGTSPVHAFSVVEFYTMYRQVPAGRHLIQVCQGPCCLIQGSEELIAHLERTLGIHCGGTTADGVFTLVRVECLALCGTGPAVMIDDQAIGPEPHALGGDLVERHLDQPGFHPTPEILDRWLAFLRLQPAPVRPQEHCSLGELRLGSLGHPGAPGALAAVNPADYAPAAPALKPAAKLADGQVTLTWVNDPLCAKVVVERSDDGASWREIACVGPKEQKAADRLEPGAKAQYRVIAHEKTRAARPSAVVSVGGQS